jgi:hypothetical protein
MEGKCAKVLIIVETGLLIKIFIRTSCSNTYIITVDNNSSKEMAVTLKEISLFLVELKLDMTD